MNPKMLAVYALLAGIPYSGGGQRREPEERPCLNCGKLKRHNNSYCSAECCKEHREKKTKN